MPWGDTFVGGFSAGSNWRHQKRQDELAEEELTRAALQHAAERDLRRELFKGEIDANAPLKAAQAANLNASADRTRTLTPAERDEIIARAGNINASTGRINLLAPAEFDETNARTRNLNSSSMRTDTLTPLEADVLRAQGDGVNLDNAARQHRLEQATRALSTPAKATVAFGEGDKSRIEFPATIDDAKKLAGVAGYKSPYADDIADLGRQIADQQAEIEGGDNRTGFLNMSSRRDVVQGAQRKRRKLQAQELSDMLNAGVIDQAEADRRANLILKGAL